MRARDDEGTRRVALAKLIENGDRQLKEAKSAKASTPSCETVSARNRDESGSLVADLRPDEVLSISDGVMLRF
jgi:hypothetical protein